MDPAAAAAAIAELTQRVQHGEQLMQVMSVQLYEQQSLLQTLFDQQSQQAAELSGLEEKTSSCIEQLKPVQPAFKELGSLLQQLQERLAAVERWRVSSLPGVTASSATAPASSSLLPRGHDSAAASEVPTKLAAFAAARASAALPSFGLSSAVASPFATLAGSRPAVAAFGGAAATAAAAPPPASAAIGAAASAAALPVAARAEPAAAPVLAAASAASTASAAGTRPSLAAAGEGAHSPAPVAAPVSFAALLASTSSTTTITAHGNSKPSGSSSSSAGAAAGGAGAPSATAAAAAAAIPKSAAPAAVSSSAAAHAPSRAPFVRRPTSLVLRLPSDAALKPTESAVKAALELSFGPVLAVTKDLSGRKCKAEMVRADDAAAAVSAGAVQVLPSKDSPASAAIQLAIKMSPTLYGKRPAALRVYAAKAKREAAAKGRPVPREALEAEAEAAAIESLSSGAHDHDDGRDGDADGRVHRAVSHPATTFAVAASAAASAAGAGAGAAAPARDVSCLALSLKATSGPPLPSTRDELSSLLASYGPIIAVHPVKHGYVLASMLREADGARLLADSPLRLPQGSVVSVARANVNRQREAHLRAFADAQRALAERMAQPHPPAVAEAEAEWAALNAGKTQEEASAARLAVAARSGKAAAASAPAAASAGSSTSAAASASASTVACAADSRYLRICIRLRSDSASGSLLEGAKEELLELLNARFGPVIGKSVSAAQPTILYVTLLREEAGRRLVAASPLHVCSDRVTVHADPSSFPVQPAERIRMLRGWAAEALRRDREGKVPAAARDAIRDAVRQALAEADVLKAQEEGEEAAAAGAGGAGGGAAGGAASAAGAPRSSKPAAAAAPASARALLPGPAFRAAVPVVPPPAAREGGAGLAAADTLAALADRHSGDGDGSEPWSDEELDDDAVETNIYGDHDDDEQGDGDGDADEEDPGVHLF